MMSPRVWPGTQRSEPSALGAELQSVSSIMSCQPKKIGSPPSGDVSTRACTRVPSVQCAMNGGGGCPSPVAPSLSASVIASWSVKPNRPHAVANNNNAARFTRRFYLRTFAVRTFHKEREYQHCTANYSLRFGSRVDFARGSHASRDKTPGAEEAMRTTIAIATGLSLAACGSGGSANNGDDDQQN